LADWESWDMPSLASSSWKEPWSVIPEYSPFCVIATSNLLASNFIWEKDKIFRKKQEKPKKSAFLPIFT